MEAHGNEDRLPGEGRASADSVTRKGAAQRRVLFQAVFDIAGSPPFAAGVGDVRWGDAEEKQRFETDELGRFELLLPEVCSTVQLRLSREDRPLAFSGVIAIPEEEKTLDAVTVHVPFGATVMGVVVDDDGKPLGGADVLCYLFPSRVVTSVVSCPPQRRAITDTSGTFVLQGITGAFRIQASLVGYFTSSFCFGEVGSHGPSEEIRLRLTPARAVTVKVLGEDAAPIPDCIVGLSCDPGALDVYEARPETLGSGAMDYVEITDAAGQVVFQNAPRSWIELSVHHSTLGDTTAQVGPDQSDAVVCLNGGFEWQVSVQDPSGAGISGASLVYCHNSLRRRARSGPDGVAAFDEMTSMRDGALFAYSPGFRAMCFQGITVERATAGQAVVLVPEQSISGYVFDDNGDPVSGASVVLHRDAVAFVSAGSIRIEDDPLGIFGLLQTRTAEDGSFRMRGLSPGMHELWFREGSKCAAITTIAGTSEVAVKLE